MLVINDYIDRMHNVVVKFVRSFLPGAKKPYRLKAVLQEELDIHDIAGKADAYNIGVRPEVIEDGLTAGLQLIRYLVADGHRVKTPLFRLKLRFPGWYDGYEIRLPEGMLPEARFIASEDFQNYLGKNVVITIDGIDQSDSIIARVIDEATGLVNECVTLDNIITVEGLGLKIETDEAHKGEVGLFLVPEADGPAVKARVLINEPKTLKALVPAGLSVGAAYTLRVVTQSSAIVSNYLLKELREIQSRFALTACT